MIPRKFTILLAASLMLAGAPVYAQDGNNDANRGERASRWGNRGERTERSERSNRGGERSDRGNRDGNANTAADDSPSTAPGGFNEYRLIVQRNIFDPNRASRRQQDEIARQNTQAQTSSEPVTEHVSLIGIWIPDDKPFALISGNRIGSAQFSVGETFKDFRVASIDTSKVVLEKDDKQITWPTGQRIERRGEGEWRVAGPAEVQVRSAPGSGSSSSGSTAGASDQNETIRRMIERRKKGG